MYVILGGGGSGHWEITGDEQCTTKDNMDNIVTQVEERIKKIKVKLEEIIEAMEFADMETE